MAVTRDQLYKDVWVEPMTTVAKRYNVASNYLARICKRLRVPHPLRGYWAQLDYGKAPEKPPLPEALPGDEVEWDREGDGQRQPPVAPKPLDEAAIRRRHESSKRPKVHPLVEETRGYFEGVRVLDTGYLRPVKRLVADVFVTEEQRVRGLDLASQLYLALDDRGYRVVISTPGQEFRFGARSTLEGQEEKAGYSHSWTPDRPTVAFVGSVAFGLYVFESSGESYARWHEGKYERVRHTSKHEPHYSLGIHKRVMPSGRLSIRAYSPYEEARWQREWRETDDGGLIRKLPRIAEELEQEAPKIVALYEEGLRQAEIQRKEWEVEKAKYEREHREQEKAKAVEESRGELLGIIEAWRVARSIEDFFVEAEQRAKKLPAEERRALLDRLKAGRASLGNVDVLARFGSWKTADERPIKKPFW